MSEKEYINEEKLSKPSTVTPTIFVGLGGCGSDIAIHVAKLLREDPDYEEKYKELIKFAVVDTNINDLEKHREFADETFLISNFEKAEYAKLASGKLFLEPDEFFTQWIPKDYRFRAGDTAGAGQIRIESRLGCYYQMKHNDFNSKFARLFDSMRDHQHGHRRIDTREIRIVICYSVAGGTGSGAHLVMAYMLKDLAKMVGNPVTIGVAVLPTIFEDKAGVNKDGIFANGYAALKETEHLMKLGSPESKFYPEDGLEFHYNPADSSKKRVYDKPFDFLYLIDKPEGFTVKDIKKATSAGLYLQLFSSIFKEQAGDYDNYTQHQRFLVPHDFEPKGIPGFTSFYGSFGSAVLHVPADSLVNYCSTAAAIGILRGQYFSQPPSDDLYADLQNGSQFYTVHQGKEDIANQIHIKDFPSKKPIRRAMMDKLFRKRVHLLAQCELEDFPSKKFSSIFVHGNPLGTVPKKLFGETPPVDERIQGNLIEDYSKSAKKPNYSIFQSIVDSIGKGGEDAPILNAALDEMRSYLDKNKPNEANNELKRQDVIDDVLKHKKKAAEKMDIILQGNDELYGLETLIEIDEFFKTQANETTLNDRRYALLQLKEYIQVGEAATVDNKKSSDVPEEGGLFGGGFNEAQRGLLINEEINLAKKVLQAEFNNLFIEKLKVFISKCSEYLEKAADREEGIESLLRRKESENNRAITQGDFTTDKYVLDGEAFQMENNIRLWDFYFLDKIQTMDELDASYANVQAKISASFQGGQTGNRANEALFKSLETYARRVVSNKILGNPEEKDQSKKYGLTITEALELEVVYRAIYQNIREDLEKNSGNKLSIIDRVLRGYRSNINAEINLEDDIHRDYLTDKMKRLIQEKAGYLCFYDDSRDGQGGVRSDKVQLVAIHDSFEGSMIAKRIKDAGGNFKFVTEAWNSRREIVFYQAILNVPLYVFGRMNRMRHFYYQFKNMAKRSKVLHIDKNWEGSLLDLDPQEAQEQHRIKMVQSNIIQFAALFSLHELSNSQNYILRFDGAYYLRNPNYNGTKVDIASDDWDFLGNSMSEAIEQLPRALSERSVRYVEYQQILNAVLKGLTPQVLQRIVAFPFKWRQSYDDLRAQYGDHPTPEQKDLLKDFHDSYRLLSNALSDLLVTIRNQVKEEETLGADGLGNILNNQLANTKSSIQLLEGFTHKWEALTNTQGASIDTGIVDTRPELFQAINADEINLFISQLGKPESTGVSLKSKGKRT